MKRAPLALEGHGAHDRRGGRQSQFSILRGSLTLGDPLFVLECA
jgi:hypothetical protein